MKLGIQPKSFLSEVLLERPGSSSLLTAKCKKREMNWRSNCYVKRNQNKDLENPQPVHSVKDKKICSEENTKL